MPWRRKQKQTENEVDEKVSEIVKEHIAEKAADEVAKEIFKQYSANVEHRLAILEAKLEVATGKKRDER